jgi:hypothetical protein
LRFWVLAMIDHAVMKRSEALTSQPCSQKKLTRRLSFNSFFKEFFSDGAVPDDDDSSRISFAAQALSKMSSNSSFRRRFVNSESLSVSPPPFPPPP